MWKMQWFLYSKQRWTERISQNSDSYDTNGFRCTGNCDTPVTWLCHVLLDLQLSCSINSCKIKGTVKKKKNAIVRLKKKKEMNKIKKNSCFIAANCGLNITLSEQHGRQLVLAVTFKGAIQQLFTKHHPWDAVPGRCMYSKQKKYSQARSGWAQTTEQPRSKQGCNGMVDVLWTMSSYKVRTEWQKQEDVPLHIFSCIVFFAVLVNDYSFC